MRIPVIERSNPSLGAAERLNEQNFSNSSIKLPGGMGGARSKLGGGGGPKKKTQLSEKAMLRRKEFEKARSAKASSSANSNQSNVSLKDKNDSI